ncbi:RRP15-like protein isoform X2 [Alligator mississippiensis]|uniref:RRP15-like protein isoform X2 n=1 Tax=Alligator mississippiensis TaxID=8496 RepID=UPI000907376A|nr:RRP15-like protein isoform X2 [Alligator mississippiensis]
MQILPQGSLPPLLAGGFFRERRASRPALPQLFPSRPCSPLPREAAQPEPREAELVRPGPAGPPGTASAERRPGKMAAAMADPRGSGVAAEESGSEWSSGLPEDSFSSEEEALEGDDEDEALCTVDENSAKSKAGTSTGWADAMAKVLNRKVPESKPTILVKNKELDKEREKEKQERLEKKMKLDKKREWEMMCRVKPDVAKDRDKERDLQRIATRVK